MQQDVRPRFFGSAKPRAAFVFGAQRSLKMQPLLKEYQNFHYGEKRLLSQIWAPEAALPGNQARNHHPHHPSPQARGDTSLLLSHPLQAPSKHGQCLDHVSPSRALLLILPLPNTPYSVRKF